MPREILIKKRLAKGLTQEQLGKLIGINSIVIQWLEKGKGIPRPKNIPKLAQAYGMEVSEFVEEIYENHTVR